MERSYMITLYAPLGEKHGVMVMQVDNLTAHGFLHILGKELLHLMVKSSVAQNKTNRDTIQLDFLQRLAK